MVEDSLRFVLPDDRSATVAPVPARLICDRLWDLGLVAGATTAAVRISDALRSSPSLRGDVVFCDREALPLLEAARSYPPTWARLIDPGALETVPRDERRQLVGTCLELMDDLAAEYEGEKLRALIDDLERLRDRLQAMTARELLRDAGAVSLPAGLRAQRLVLRTDAPLTFSTPTPPPGRSSARCKARSS